MQSVCGGSAMPQRWGKWHGKEKNCIYSIQILLESCLYQSYYYLPSQSLDS